MIIPRWQRKCWPRQRKCPVSSNLNPSKPTMASDFHSCTGRITKRWPGGGITRGTGSRRALERRNGTRLSASKWRMLYAKASLSGSIQPIFRSKQHRLRGAPARPITTSRSFFPQYFPLPTRNGSQPIAPAGMIMGRMTHNFLLRALAQPISKLRNEPKARREGTAPLVFRFFECRAHFMVDAIREAVGIGFVLLI